MNILNFEQQRRKRLRELLTTAFRGQLPQPVLSESELELAAWQKEMERRRLDAQVRYAHDPAFNPKLPKLKPVS